MFVFLLSQKVETRFRHFPFLIKIDFSRAINELRDKKRKIIENKLKRKK